MNKEKDILAKLREADNPYSVPEGYFSTIEDRVREKIAAPGSKSPVWAVAKPALLLTCMFAVILGIGYGTMALTGTAASDRTSEYADETDILAEETFSVMGDDEIIEYLSDNLSSSDIEMLLADLTTNQNR